MRNDDYIACNSACLDLMERFEAFPAGCDPAFDNELEELEREYAELRLTFGKY